MIYDSTSVPRAGIPLYVHPASIYIGESQKEKKRRRAGPENQGSRARRGRSSVKEEVERSEKKSWWISCLNKWGGGKLFDQWACLSSPHPATPRLERVFTTQTKRNFLNLNISRSIWIPCFVGELINFFKMALHTLFPKLSHHKSVEEEANSTTL